MLQRLAANQPMAASIASKTAGRSPLKMAAALEDIVLTQIEAKSGATPSSNAGTMISSSQVDDQVLRKA